ncbi:hypothetical protein ACFLYU_00485 [Candidatus Dependentiae bacterium]
MVVKSMRLSLCCIAILFWSVHSFGMRKKEQEWPNKIALYTIIEKCKIKDCCFCLFSTVKNICTLVKDTFYPKNKYDLKDYEVVVNPLLQDDKSEFEMCSDSQDEDESDPDINAFVDEVMGEVVGETSDFYCECDNKCNCNCHDAKPTKSKKKNAKKSQCIKKVKSGYMLLDLK